MKRIKQLNGFIIYEATKKDEKKYNVGEGLFYIYTTEEINDYGLTYAYCEMEAGSVKEAIDFIKSY